MFSSHIQGIPCQIKVLDYDPGDPGFTAGAPENCWEPEGETFDFQVLDRRGRPAPWLERKMTDSDVERILEEFLARARRG